MFKYKPRITILKEKGISKILKFSFFIELPFDYYRYIIKDELVFESRISRLCDGEKGVNKFLSTHVCISEEFGVKKSCFRLYDDLP